MFTHRNHYLNETERKLLEKYAQQLGYLAHQAIELVKKSVKGFSGHIKYEDYRTLLKSEYLITRTSSSVSNWCLKKREYSITRVVWKDLGME